MKLLIVEDEPRLRDSLAFNIPWEDNGIEMIGMAANGREALALMERIRPDLVLLDIHMPEMNGLALAEAIVRQDAGIRMIVLSGYNQFEYAQRAMQLGIDKYLLKPAEDTEILNAVLEAAELARRDLEHKHSMDDLARRWSQHLPLLRDRFLQHWVAAGYAKWEVKKWSDTLGEAFVDRSRFVIAVVEMDPLPASETRFSEQDLSLLQFSLQCIAKELLEPANCCVFPDSAGSTVLMFYGDGAAVGQTLLGRANGSTTRVLAVVRECLKLTASAGIGQPVAPEKVPLSYRQARLALRHRILHGNDIAIPHHEAADFGDDSIADAELPVKQLEMLLVSGDCEGSTETLRKLLAESLRRAHTIEAMQEEVLALSGMMIRIVREQGVTLRQVVGEDFELFTNIDSLRTKDHMVDWLERTVRRIAGFFAASKQREQHHLVTSAQKLIKEQVDQPLTLYSIAEMLYTTPSYLSRLFKQEAGKPFSEYVLDQRMERARQLLQSGDRKVYDVSRSVGFRDVSYFTKVFRRYWGITPGEARGASAAGTSE